MFYFLKYDLWLILYSSYRQGRHARLFSMRKLCNFENECGNAGWKIVKWGSWPYSFIKPEHTYSPPWFKNPKYPAEERTDLKNWRLNSFSTK